MTDPASVNLAIDPAAYANIAPQLPEEARLAPHLPRDHPAWARDVAAISSRTRHALASLRPLVVRVLTFWDHRVRHIAVGARTLAVDAAGCYRLR